MGSAKMAVHFSSKTSEWETPQDFFDLLNSEFHFELDVCAKPENAKCPRYFTPEEVNHMIGIKDSNGRPISEGDTVSIKVKTWYGFLEIRRGQIKFIRDDLSSWGCGYAVMDPHRGPTFLSSICRSNTVIEVVEQ